METKLSDRSQSEFNAYRCGSCGRIEELKFCSCCKLICFCSKSCQVTYWNKHKQLCRVIGKLMTADGKNSIYEIRNEELKDLGAKKLMKAIVLLIQMLPNLLGRELKFEEYLLLSYPKYCEVCFNTVENQLARCPSCKFSAFCKKGECQTKAAADPSIHKNYCAAKKIAFLNHRNVEYQKVFTEMPSTLDFSEFLQNNPERDLFTFIEKVSGKQFVKNPANRNNMASFATVCQFNFVATLISALHKTTLLNCESLNLDIVGAKYEETYFNTSTCCLFYICMPQLKSIRVNLIGPELTRSRSETLDCFGKVVKIGYHKMFYENYRGPKPDFIMCFNCGFSEDPWGTQMVPGFQAWSVMPWTPDTDWVRGIRKILNHKVPFGFTSYTKSELIGEVWFMRRVADQMGVYSKITGVFLGENAFKDLRPFQNFDKAAYERLCYGNHSLCVINWKEFIGDDRFQHCKFIFERQIS